MYLILQQLLLPLHILQQHVDACEIGIRLELVVQEILDARVHRVSVWDVVASVTLGREHEIGRHVPFSKSRSSPVDHKPLHMELSLATSTYLIWALVEDVVVVIDATSRVPVYLPD